MSDNKWFRFYHEVLDDPKVQRLEPGLFKHWVNLLCLACRTGGKLPRGDDVSFALRVDIITLDTVLERLLGAGLIEVRKNGTFIHGWEKRQYKSDTSTDRVKRFRQRSKNVAETPNVTPPDTETETEKDKPPVVPQTGDTKTRVSFDLVVKQWNILAEAKDLSKVEKLTEARKRAFKARAAEFPDIEDWKRAIQNIAANDWLCGANDKGWRADFDFMLQAKSFPRLVENTYGRR